ncbi:trichohyalin-like [Montipora capricornis]|uniref:trichohyalin-like n=1 Tax=Montipora capricornis TaxID=246305 RepID=UPI0035F20F65
MAARSANQENLIQRVQELTKENKKLRGVLVQNDKMLKILEEQVKKHIGEKLSQSSSEVESKPSTPKQLQSLNEEVKRLEGEKAMLQINISKVQEHISCLRTALHEAEKSTIEGDERETLVSMGSLIPSSDQTSMESMQSRYSKLETDKEILLVNLQKLKIEKEQIQQQYENLEEEHKLLTKHLAELEQIKTLDNAAVVESGQVTELSCQLEKQTESERTLKEELDAVKEERDEFKKRVDELVDDLTKARAEDAFGKGEDTEMNKKYTELKHQVLMFEKREVEIVARENALFREKEEAQRRESAENEEIEQMEQLLQNYKDKEKVAQEAVNKLLASQAKLGDEVGKLRQQMETEKLEFQKQLDDLMQERDTYKAKAEEMHTPTSEDKPSQEEVLGDADLKEKYLRVKKQLWKYQERDNYIQDKENALLEKEKAYTQTLVKQGKDLQRQLAEVRVKEEALTQEKQRHEEEIKILKKQLGETHEHEVLLLKEDLHTKSQEMAAVQTNEKCLREQLLKLQLENQNLSVECEKCRADCKKQEEETQSVKRRLSETHEQEYLLLKEQLRNKELALETSQTSEEHMKAQVTQLIQENDSLGIELERLKEDLQQQENLYQDHLHKVTQDSEHQRSKRDDIIKALRTQLATTEKEFHKAQAHIDKSNASTRDLHSKLEQLRAKNQELVESHNSVLDSNKRHERNEEDLAIHLRESDRLVEKLKEDAALKERELNELKEERYDLEKQQEEKNQILNHQLEVYKRDFEAERAARETEHGEKLQLRDDIRQLQQENQYFQDQMDRLGNLQMHEMQRRHGSYVPEAHESQQQRGWFDFPLGYFGGRQDEIPRNPEGHRQEEPPVFGPQGDWICPTCHRSFDDFNTLQLHAVGCNGVSPAPVNQCPICMEVFPEIDTLEIHAQECGN